MLERVDDWMHRPGARVVGHRARVTGDGGAARATCTCGHRSPAYLSAPAACLALTQHLAAAVRRGAVVTPGSEGGPDGEAGVREPRRPRPPFGAGGVALDPTG